MGSADQCQHDEADIHPRPCGRRLRPVRPRRPRPWLRPRQEINPFFVIFWWQPSDADSLHKDNTVMMRFPRFVSNDDRKRLSMLVHKTTLNYLAIYYSLVIFLFP